MKTSANGIKLIKGYEKCSLTAYKKFPKEPWTIGWGSTFYPDGKPVKEGDVITQQKADEMFLLILPKFEREVDKRITRTLLQREYDAAVCFAYNAGCTYMDGGHVRDFNLWHNINANMQGKPMYDYWTTLCITSGGVKANGLIRRRKSEITMYQTGVINFFE